MATASKKAAGLSEERLLDDLTALGVVPGGILMVHASLRKIGLARGLHGPGGADLILDVLDRLVGPDGTLLMVLGTAYGQDWVNQRAPARRADLLAGSEPLDLSTAPAIGEVGWLAEAFRRRPGTIVSGNPSGRFGARGPAAEALLRRQPWHDYYGPGSPLQKLCDAGGRILRLGANDDTVTALHYAEYLARLPHKRRTRWDYLLRTENGPRHAWVECLDDSEGIAVWDGDDYFALILNAYLDAGRARRGCVGHAPSELIEAADIVRFGTAWMEANL
ncbi:aminoglycoside N(3)-acetyltransferase [Sphingosinicella sp. CPCC 101087]|uniref:aminoglycoside N(3)-acetyltransferase n=1 Tax=Sphingosinicella sp. CPCC 101087 TaxID=2497754 RepID=UPI00101D0B27|nr:AAC(3) family N-acetyltransferase [Sphingosinicella sp. CPCC 101087]